MWEWECQWTKGFGECGWMDESVSIYLCLEIMVDVYEWVSDIKPTLMENESKCSKI